MSHRTQTKSFVEEPFCFSDFFWYRKKKLWIRGGLSRFSVEIFTSHIAENFREGILLFGEKFWFQKVLWVKRGLSRFFVGIFRSHSARKFRGHPFNVSEILGIENFYASERGVSRSPSKVFFTQYQKFSLGNTSVFQKNSCTATFYA